MFGSDEEPDELVADCSTQQAYLFARNNLRVVRVDGRLGVLHFDGTIVSLSQGESNKVKVRFAPLESYADADDECLKEMDKLSFRPPL